MVREDAVEDWRPMVSLTVRRAPCTVCKIMSSWHPRNWYYRRISVKGEGIHGRKVTTERLCSSCAVRHVSVGGGHDRNEL